MEIEKNNLRIGVTGGIGTGKSTVCRIFEVLGYPVFYADDEAKKVMTEDPELVAEIRSHFGDQVYTKDGQVNRKLLSEIIFSDEKKLNLLNSSVHPATIRAYERWEANQKAAMTFKEAALLFETGTYKLSDYNILVVAPMGLRVTRVMQRDGLTAESVEARIKKQMTDEEKQKLADFIIENDEVKALIPQVLKLHGHLLELLKNRF